MPTRYSTRLRPRYADDEPTWGESASRGLEQGIATILKTREANREWENEMARAGGTVERGPSIRERIGNVGRGISSIFMPRKNEPAPNPMTTTPPIVPWNPRGGGPVLPDDAPDNRPVPDEIPTKGVGAMLRDGGFITQRGPSGQTARIPIPRQKIADDPDALRAAIAKARAGDPTDLYALRPDLIDNDPKLFPPKPTGESVDTFREKDDIRTANDLKVTREREGASRKNATDLENLRTKNDAYLIGERARNRVDDGTGPSYSQETARANAQVSAGQKIMESAVDRTGEVINQAEYDRGKRIMDEGLRMLGVESGPDAGMQARRMNASPQTIKMRRDKLMLDARKRYPGKSEEWYRSTVTRTMQTEGWPVR